ncbi:MAG: hypothetical protein KAW82_01350 [Desulfurellaceae bacterium]|nr:hypothetical protein [Desulfurellaceae bacterium]
MKKIKNLLQNISQNRFFNITIIIIIIISLFSIIAYEGGIATTGLKIHYKTIEIYMYYSLYRVSLKTMVVSHL